MDEELRQKLLDEVLPFVGNTPILSVNGGVFSDGLKEVEFLLKLEKFNYSGSIKDRTAYGMLLDGIEQGKINQDTIIVEATSGNTGIALAWMCCRLGLRFKVVIPQGFSKERSRFLELLGAEVVYVEKDAGVLGAMDVAQGLSLEGGYCFLNQFSNEANPQIHYKMTAVEIWNEVEFDIEGIFIGVGTGGTISGIGKFFKERMSRIKVLGILPQCFPHKIEGIGANFRPKVLDDTVIDELIYVDDDGVFEMVNMLMDMGIMVGISSAAAIYGGINWLKKSGFRSGKWVIICPDGIDRYLSVVVDRD